MFAARIVKAGSDPVECVANLLDCYRELQDIFVAFVEQINKSKVAVQNILAKAETLKKALMQEYFG